MRIFSAFSTGASLNGACVGISPGMVFTVAGAGCAKANGIYKPVDMPNYSGVQAYSNGAVVLYRWHRKHWVLR